jgi:hypothetical protein
LQSAEARAAYSILLSFVDAEARKFMRYAAVRRRSSLAWSARSWE